MASSKWGSWAGPQTSVPSTPPHCLPSEKVPGTPRSRGKWGCLHLPPSWKHVVYVGISIWGLDGGNPEHSGLNQLTFQGQRRGLEPPERAFGEDAITGSWPKREPRTGVSPWVTGCLLLYYLLILICFQMRKPRPREEVTCPKPLG